MMKTNNVCSIHANLRVSTARAITIWNLKKVPSLHYPVLQILAYIGRGAPVDYN